MVAVTYCRVSTVEQTKNLSLSTQRSACREYCAQHGHRIVEEFVEEGESAKTTNRLALNRMLEFCVGRKHRVELVVVYNVSRLARNRLDHLLVRTSLAGLGITLRSVTEPIDDTSVGKFTEGILSTVAQFENDQKSERTKVGMIAALERGRWTHQAPVGYRTGHRDGPSLVPDETKGELIRVAFDLVAEGVTPAEALRRIHDLGLRTRKGAPLPLSSFHRLLRNPLYAGRIKVAWGVNGPGDFKAIVPEEVFERVQRQLTGRATNKTAHRRSDNPEFPLRGFVRCSSCDSGLTGSTSHGRSQKYSYYHCYRCKSVRVTRHRLDADFITLLERLRPTEGALRLFEAIVRDVYAQRRRGAVEASALAERRVGELQRKLDNLEEAFIFKKSIDEQTYVPLRDRLRDELRSAEIVMAHECVEHRDVEVELASSAKVLCHASELWQGATLERRKRLQRALFPRGLAHNGESFRTGVTCIGMNDLDDDDEQVSSLASQGECYPLPCVGRWFLESPSTDA
jgi:site-specific DNA recombinase